jgi:hypothetical protein
MYSNANLPPLVAPPIEAEEVPRTQMSVVAIAALIALAVTAVAIGWGFTQWSSARDWRHRSEATEAHFTDLEARTERAETQRVTAQRTAARTRNRLIKAEKKLATAANQQAFTRDMRFEVCLLLPGMPADQRARICP